MFYTVPCGKCVECEQEKIDSYLIRAYAETRYTQSRSGLAYVDCLTYHDGDLPIWNGKKVVRNNWQPYNEDKVYNGIACFNKKDVRNFFIKLRASLERAGYYKTISVPQYEIDGSVTYIEKHYVPIKHFLTSEYGGQFHRPHHHILLFVDLDISPEVLESFVEKCWSHGMIDKTKKDGSPKQAKDKVINGNGAIAYVAKYVIKDDSFYTWLKAHVLDCIRTNMYEDQETKLDSLLDDYLGKEVINAIEPFTFTSNGFGISLADKYSYDNQGNIIEHNRDYKFMYDTGMIQMFKPAESKPGENLKSANEDLDRLIKIPQYIKRKLWYEPIKDFDGSYHWQLNTEGLRQKEDHLNQSIDFLAERYQNIYDNLGNYMPDSTTSELRSKQNKILDLLNGRSFTDFAVYINCYKGRLFENFELQDIYDLHTRNAQYSTDQNFDYKNSISLSEEDFSLKKVFRRFYSKQKKCYSPDYKGFLQLLQENYLVNQDSSYFFDDFDKLYNLFDELQHNRNKDLTIQKEFNKAQKEKAKLLDPRYAAHERANEAHRKALEKIINRIHTTKAYE